MAYNDIAEELGGDTPMEDLDETYIKLAREWAQKNKKKWPPRPRQNGVLVYISSWRQS
jgi:hypothetical protein